MPAADRMSRWTALPLLIPPCCASCAGLARNDQGPLQPQAVSGPGQVKKSFILGQASVNAEITVGNSGQACSFILFKPDLQIVLDAALVTSQPEHGRAAAALINAERQATVSYAPHPGHVGPDHFGIALEPNDRGVTFAVTVQPSAPAS